MKKNRLIPALLLSLSGLASFSASAEDRAGLGLVFDYGFGITGQYNGNINASIGNDGFGADYIFTQNEINGVSKLTWYVSAGAGLHHLFDSNKDTSIKVRGQAGLDFDFAPDFDGFLAVGPDIKLYTDSDASDSIKFGLDAILGIRYFF